MKTIICIILFTLLVSIALAMPNKPTVKKMQVTAYCENACCCGDYADGITASGHIIKDGDRFVAAPPEIPFGTMISIPGYNNGEAVEVLDRGSAIVGDRLDVFFGGVNGHRRALEWGVQELDVQIVESEYAGT